MTSKLFLGLSLLALAGSSVSQAASTVAILGAGGDKCAQFNAVWKKSTLMTQEEKILQLEYVTWMQGFSATSAGKPRPH